MKIDVKNLKKSYEGKIVLDIENCTFEENKITAVLGSNGSGKTTFMRILSGIDCKFTGELKYNNAPLNKEILRRVTMVFQNGKLFKQTAAENMEYPLYIRGILKEEREIRVKKIAEELEISNLLHRRGNTLSGGEAQKVLLARSIIFEPDVLILDEATANIDSNSKQTIEKVICRYKKKNKTVILISHDLNQVSKIADNIIELDSGKILI